MELADYIIKCNEAKDSASLYRILEKALLDLCGYDRVIFSLMSDHSSLGLRAGHGIMRNYPDDWMKHYVEKGYEHVDPVRQFGFRHVGPFIWDSLPLVLSLTKQQTICMDQCREAGFYNGAAICLRGLTGELGGIGVASADQKRRDNEREARHKIALFNVIAQSFYASFTSLHQRTGIQQREEVHLTAREVQVVQHMAMAKRDDAIAFDLNMTTHAVDFHIRNIMRKFRARNRIAVVLQAVNGGFVGLENVALVRQTPRRQPNNGRPSVIIQSAT